MNDRKIKDKVECIMCGYCCGYRRNYEFGGASYMPDEEVPENIEVVKSEEGFTIPVDEDDVCIYLEKLDNGFTRCTIQDKKPRMCKLYYCLTENKVKRLKVIVDELKEKCE